MEEICEGSHAERVWHASLPLRGAADLSIYLLKTPHGDTPPPPLLWIRPDEAFSLLVAGWLGYGRLAESLCWRDPLEAPGGPLGGPGGTPWGGPRGPWRQRSAPRTPWGPPRVPPKTPPGEKTIKKPWKNGHFQK